MSPQLQRAVLHHLGGGHPLADFQCHAALAQHEVVARQHIVESMQVEGQNVQLQLSRQQEGALMEAQDAFGRACPLGKDDDGVAAAHQVAQAFLVALHAVGHGIKFRHADDFSVVRVAPYPLLGQDGNPGVQCHHGDEVELRLVVADDQCGPAEVLAHAVDHAEGSFRHPVYGKARKALQYFMDKQAALRLVPHEGGIDEDDGETQTQCQEKGAQRVERAGYAAQRQGVFAHLAVHRGQPAEHDGRQPERHVHHHGHADDGHLAQRAQRRMLREDQDADAHQHDEGRQHHTALVGLHHPTAVGVLVHQSLGDEDGVVVALSEDKCGQDDVDDVELQAEQVHAAQYPHPSDGQRQERNDAQLEAAEAQPQEGKDDKGADEAYVVERIRQGRHQVARHIASVKGKGPGGQRATYRGFRGSVAGCVYVDEADDLHPVRLRQDEVVCHHLHRFGHFVGTFGRRGVGPPRRKGCEGIFGEAGVGTGGAEICGQGGMCFAELAPCLEVGLLPALRGDVGTDTPDVLHAGCGGEAGLQVLVAAECLLERASLGHDVERACAGRVGHACLQFGQVGALRFGHVVDVHHVGIKRGAQTEVKEQAGEGQNYKALSFF